MDRNARPLNEVLEHLPIPVTGYSGRSPEERRAARPAGHGGVRDRIGDLEVVARALPTPQASDWKGSGATQGRDRDGRARTPGDADLPEAVEMLPTPRATDGTKGGPNQRGSSGDLMLPSADSGRQHEVAEDDGDLEAVVIGISGRRRKDRAGDGQLIMPGTSAEPARYLAVLTPTAGAWGKYAPGIARWESVLGRPAPPPTQPGRDGKPRLSPLAVEFMMGLPPGWVCDVPGLSRSQMLKLLGNGVVPRQGILALSMLAGLLPARVRASLLAVDEARPRKPARSA